MKVAEERKFRTSSRELTMSLLAAKNEAARLGLWRTFHAIDGATTAIGWEVAEWLTAHSDANQ